MDQSEEETTVVYDIDGSISVATQWGTVTFWPSGQLEAIIAEALGHGHTPEGVTALIVTFLSMAQHDLAQPFLQPAPVS